MWWWLLLLVPIVPWRIYAWWKKKHRLPCVVNLQPSQIKRGMVVFARTDGTLGFLIRVGERGKWKNGKYNHECVVVEEGTTYDTVMVVQATLRGVKKTSLAEIIQSAHVVDLFDPPEQCDVDKMVEFSMKMVGDDYSLFSIIAIAIDIISPESFPALRRDYTWICSALSEESMRYAGCLHDWADIYTVTPTQSFMSRTWSVKLTLAA